MAAPTTDRRPVRWFALTVDVAPKGTFGVTLIETDGYADHRRPVARLPAARYEKAADTVADAVTASGHKTFAVRPGRDEPIRLDEQPGVRLALALNVIDGIRKPGRARAILDGINRLSDEECLYWYAAALSDTSSAPRRLRALRLYLADD